MIEEKLEETEQTKGNSDETTLERRNNKKETKGPATLSLGCHEMMPDWLSSVTVAMFQEVHLFTALHEPLGL